QLWPDHSFAVREQRHDGTLVRTKTFARFSRCRHRCRVRELYDAACDRIAVRIAAELDRLELEAGDRGEALTLAVLAQAKLFRAGFLDFDLELGVDRRK